MCIGEKATNHIGSTSIAEEMKTLEIGASSDPWEFCLIES